MTLGVRRDRERVGQGCHVRAPKEFTMRQNPLPHHFPVSDMQSVMDPEIFGLKGVVWRSEGKPCLCETE